MRSFRIIFAAACAVALGSTACAARSSYVAYDWNDLVAKVSCKDVTQQPDGQWQISAEVSFSGSIKADPFVPADNVDALKKKCPPAAAH